MTTYVDSSALIPLYISERFSESADAVLRRAGQVPFTALHQLEIRNAFERLVGRDLITREECRLVQRHLQEDLESLRLMPVSLDLDQLFIGAGELSAAYAAKHLARGLDLLHIAAAHAAGCRKFVSADDRQLAVAKASGLGIADIKRPARRKKG